MPTTIDIEVTGSEIIDVTVNTVVNTVEIDMQPVTNVIEIDFSNTVPGPAGPAGADGADGSVWHRGTGAPSDGTGQDGDYYIDDSASTWYGPKAAGTWTGTGPNSFSTSTDHGGLTGLSDDDHTQYSKADGTRWTTTPTANRIVVSNSSGNIVVSDIVFNDATNSVDFQGNYLFVRDVASGGAIFVGSTINKGSLSDNDATSTFQIQRSGGILSLVGGTGLKFTSSGGTTFSWPSADGSAGYVLKTDGSGNLALVSVMTLVDAASDTAAGKVELAISSEVQTGSDGTRAVTPASLVGTYVAIRSHEVEVFRLMTGDNEVVTAGDGAARFSIPEELDGWKLINVFAFCGDPGVTGNLTLMAHNETISVDMLNSALVIASGDTESGAVSINTSNDQVSANDIIRTDIDTVSSTPQEGLKVRYTFGKP